MLIGLTLFVFGGTAQAQDPYLGTYSCSSSSVQGCEQYKYLKIESPKKILITRSGYEYGLTDENGTVIWGEIIGGVGHFRKEYFLAGGNYEASVETSANAGPLDSFTWIETGTITGDKNCNYTVQAICTK